MCVSAGSQIALTKNKVWVRKYLRNVIEDNCDVAAKV